MAEPRRLRELRESIEARANFPEPPHVIALSGGADSAALAAVTDAMSTGSSRAVHVHHGLPDSDTLASAAGAVAEAIGIGLDVIHAQVGEGPSPEAMAREARYRALRDHVGEGEAILLGHTMNDQAETLLLNLIRGGATRGLSGMPYHRPPNLYRPFLEVTRDETRELAVLAGLPFADDPTNFDRSIRRNKVRLDLVPLLEDLNPNLVESLARTAAHLRIDAEYLDDEAARRLRPIEGDDVVSAPASMLLLLPAAIRSRALARMAGPLRAQSALTSAETERIEAVLVGSADATELEGNLRVSRSGPHLEFRRLG